MGKKPFITPSTEQNTMMLGDDEGVIQNMNTPQGSHFANSVSPHPHKHNYVITV